jgi:hypothetical protein
LKNGKKDARLIETPYQNLMLDKEVLRIEERPAGHMLVLPQEVVRQDVWIKGFQRKHSSRRQSP